MVRSRLLVLVVLAISAACGSAGPPPTSARCATDAERGLVAVEFRAACVTVEVAATGPERQLGLMNRTDLGEDNGMLFIFPEARRGGFWMKNTLIPLSIAYMGRGDGETYEVLKIMDMEPCEADPCPSYDPGLAYVAALEVNQGWFADVGVEEGATARVRGALPTPS